MVALLAATVLVAGAATPCKKMSKLIERGLDFCLKQEMLMYDAVKDQPEALVNTARGGKLETCSSSSWMSGFFPGTLWYLYEYSSDPEVLAAAEEMTSRMAPEQYNTSNHDVGFMIGSSYGQGYRLTGREDYRKVLLTAAESLSTRFNPQVGCTRSWGSRPSAGWDFVVIIDNMMNLELLTKASALGGDLKYIDIARTHANTTMRNHFRNDFSTWHVLNYDEATGEIISRQTEQGWRDDSTWARGQAWGLYGFTMMYRQTGDEAYLQRAIDMGKYLLDQPNMPSDKVPYWDYDVPVDKATPRDASAAAIMASAFIELSTFVVDETLSARFLKMAEAQLKSLSSKKYRAALGQNANFAIMHCTANNPKQDFDTPLVYADYYYIEALMRYRRLLAGETVVDPCLR